MLEDDPCCNAGRGSNLNLDGAVECDASAMDSSTGAWGGVAAVPGVRNPVRAASLLAAEQRVPLSHGRVRPMLLCGEGARLYCAASLGDGSTPLGSDGLVTAEAQRRWKRYSDWLETDSGRDGEEVGGRRADGEVDASHLSDTVGAVCQRRQAEGYD